MLAAAEGIQGDELHEVATDLIGFSEYRIQLCYLSLFATVLPIPDSFIGFWDLLLFGTIWSLSPWMEVRSDQIRHVPRISRLGGRSRAAEEYSLARSPNLSMQHKHRTYGKAYPCLMPYSSVAGMGAVRAFVLGGH